jgi:Mrp family chromosome partitioning ATPase
VDPALAEIHKKFESIKHVIFVLSGKGGVGKSTIATQLAILLSKTHEVGLLDVDICGPSVPTMLGLCGREVHHSAEGWSPVYLEELAVMSIGFLVNNPNDAIVWRGPRKNGLIKQFLMEVNWGKLDYLIIDSK